MTIAGSSVVSWNTTNISDEGRNGLGTGPEESWGTLVGVAVSVGVAVKLPAAGGV